MHRDPYLTRPYKELDHMPMVLLVQNKRSALISYQNNCRNCRYSRKRPARPLIRIPPLPKRHMYIVCNRQTRRPPNNLMERKKQRKKGKGDKKTTNNDGGGNTEKMNSKYPCNLCMEDHPTHQCPRLAETQTLLVQ
jgi:hypothetical protein